MRRLIFILLAMIGVSQAQTIQYIGAPTTTVISRGNFRTDSIFYLPKRSKAPTDTAAFRYQISDSSLYVWTGSQWVKAGGSGTISGTGITGYLPQFNGTTTLDTSALFTLGNRLGIGTSTFAYNSTNTANMELNGTAGGILGFKRNDSARGYLWHTGDNMELANTVAGSIFFNTNSATRGSISSAGVWRLHNLAGTGDRVVIASSNGTLSASTSVTGLVDTATISTRAWRQKGDDSLGAIIATKGSGTVTSVATGYGLSGGTITTTGTLLVDTLNIATRAWRQKGLDSLAALEVSGSGTTNYVAKFTAASTIGNSQIFDNGTNVGIGTTTAGAKLEVNLASGVNIITARGPEYAQVRHTDGVRTFFTQVYDNVGFLGMESNTPLVFGTNNTERLRIFANGRIGVNTTTDAGYQFDVNGTLRSVNGANFATTSGNVGIGTASPANKAHIVGSATTLGVLRIENNQNRSDVNHGTINIVNTKSYAIGNDMGIMFSAYRSDNTEIDPRASIAAIVSSSFGADLAFSTRWGAGSASEKMRITELGEILINTTSDAGDYKLQVSGNIYNTGSAVFAATSGGVAIGTTTTSGKLNILGDNDQINLNTTGTWSAIYFKNAGADRAAIYVNNTSTYLEGRGSSGLYLGGAGATAHVNLNSNGEFIIGTGASDAGDYKLQVVGNARVGTGKLDIVSNTAFGLSVTRSGTDVVAGQIYNSNGILYLGAESSTGGQIFTGSSAYAAVIGSGANYPLQFATNNATRATINTNGELLINTTTDNGDFKLQVNGNALISGSIKTANGGSSTAVPWHLGSVVATSVQLDTANYVEVEINGTFYRLAIVTPL